MKLRLLVNNHSDKLALNRLLLEFKAESGDGDGQIDVRRFIDSHYAVYFVIRDNIIIGFTSYLVYEYFGLLKSKLSNTFVYIEPKHRKSKALHLISIQTGILCESLGLPLELSLLATEGSSFLHRMEGKKEYVTYSYELQEVCRETKRLQTKVRIKK